jgi:DNA-directed RNA polymerase specialized sigma24 family protein
MDVLDEARFAELSERHRRELQVHSYRMLGNLELAEDAVQEALLRAWKGRASFAGGPGARAWLYRIVTTTCFDILRAAQRRGERVESIADVPWLQPCPDALLDAAGGPEGAAILRETVELAYLAVIQLLPARQRAVLLRACTTAGLPPGTRTSAARATAHAHQPPAACRDHPCGLSTGPRPPDGDCARLGATVRAASRPERGAPAQQAAPYSIFVAVAAP